MKSITINGSLRESVGKKSTKALRNAGKVPCVLYGGDKPVHFEAEEKAFKNLIYTPNVHTVVVDLGKGETYHAVAQDMQWHPTREQLLHIDFYQIFDDKPVTMEIPVRTVGSARGVLNGGVLRRNLRKLKVKALPQNLPDFIEVDITKLKIGQKVYVRELRSEKLDIMHSDSLVVLMVKTSRTAIVDETEEEEGEEGETAEGEEGAAEGEEGAESEGGDDNA